MLSEEQLKVCDKIIDWFSVNFYNSYKRCKNDRSNYLTIGGYAGTGKTFLIGSIRKEIEKRLRMKPNISYCSFTGKAASVLKSKLDELGNLDSSRDFVGTIHRLMYIPEFIKDKKTGKTSLIRWRKTDYINADLIIIDEASMVNNQLWNDLLSYGIPIIAVGDHGQLPPVGEEKSNIMIKPHFVLKEVHRQALDSPIIKLSVGVRNEGCIPYGIYDKTVLKMNWLNQNAKNIFNNINWNEDTICLCGFNATRVKLNNYIRNKKQFTQPDPYPGERLICLKNNYDTKIMNGQIGTLSWVTMHSKDLYCMDIKIDNTDSLYSNLVHTHCFGKERYDDAYDMISPKKVKTILKKTDYSSIDLFDFGYAISVHKSQGSEFQKVVLFEQRSKHWDDEYYSKWLYTAITRAKEKLLIIGGFNHY